MARRLRWATSIIVICLTATSLWAQTQIEPWPRPNPIRNNDAAAQPDQPVNPQLPTLERRAARRRQGKPRHKFRPEIRRKDFRSLSGKGSRHRLSRINRSRPNRRPRPLRLHRRKKPS